MQVNDMWIPKLAERRQATPLETFRVLRDNFCAHVEGGAWILRKSLNEAKDDFWEGIARYHSHSPEHKVAYLRKVLQQVLRLQRGIQKTAAQ